MLTKIEAFEILAHAFIGDGKTPDLFFVSDEGAIVSVSADFEAAYLHFEKLAARCPRKECALENRTFGVIASVEPETEAPNARLVLRDDVQMFLGCAKTARKEV